ncbi:AAA family ATPase [Naasia aerilata]|uniref:Pilus biosynthesis protein CpaE n=1 Tax=Naasia aerilata TaxID=1162966 RepID=A0ABN6XQ80_9MICO|nr:regulator [Naasia aerilata]BDZ46022.1 pilus biosynthesis protein CpaE [Naasia aerilata]
MRLLLALDPATEDRILGDILRSGHEVLARPAGGVELAAALRALPAEAALVAASPRMLSAGVLAAADRAGVRLVALAESGEDRRAAAALGLREVLDGSASWAEMEAVLSGAPAGAPTVHVPHPPAARGRVVAVWGPTGAPGRTTTAITLAAEAALGGARVILADADTHGAAVAPSLGLLDEAPGFAAACRLAGSGRLDPGEIGRVAERYAVGRSEFAVLTGIARPSRWPELSAERVTGTLAVCRTCADVTVVDAGFNLESDEEIVSDLFAPRRNAATLAALREADLVVAVGAADPVGLARLIRGHAELAELVPPEVVRVVVTRVRSGVIGLSPASQIAATLLRFAGITDAALIPEDRAAYDAALLTGRTLQAAAPRSPALAALRAFAERELRPAGERRRERRSRLRLPGISGRRGPAAPPIGAA